MTGHLIVTVFDLGSEGRWKTQPVAVCSCGRTFALDHDAHDPRLAWEIAMMDHVRGRKE